MAQQLPLLIPPWKSLIWPLAWCWALPGSPQTHSGHAPPGDCPAEHADCQENSKSLKLNSQEQLLSFFPQTFTENVASEFGNEVFFLCLSLVLFLLTSQNLKRNKFFLNSTFLINYFTWSLDNSQKWLTFVKFVCEYLVLFNSLELSTSSKCSYIVRWSMMSPCLQRRNSAEAVPAGLNTP